MVKLCGLLGVKKQAYYQHKDTLQKKLEREAFVIQFVYEIRRIAPGIGGPKLYEIYKRRFGDNYELKIGRDKMETILRENGLNIRKPRRMPRTTDSRHGLPLYPDLRKNLLPIRPNELWVADITYIPLWDEDMIEYHFCYLSLITDDYTKEIIGWCVGETLETCHCIEALTMAMERLIGVDPIDLIHHTDRGVQYASEAYVVLLKEAGIKISMTESGDPKDNPVAERQNETVKFEFMKDLVFHSVSQVRNAMPQIVSFYNNERPHMSIDNMTPAEAAKCTGRIQKRWTSFREQHLTNLQVKEGATSLVPQTLVLIDRLNAEQVNDNQG